MTGQFDSIAYLHEKFSAGLDILATHPDSIKERLLDAYGSQVTRGDRPSPGR